jgi:hypothetical protein
MTDEAQSIPESSGNLAGDEPYKVGYKKPPKDTQFGGPRAPARGKKPKSFDQLRALAQKISHEPIADSSSITVAEAILRTMAKENPARFVEIAFGKVPDITENKGKVEIVVTYRDQSTHSAPSAEDDQSTGESL